MTDVAIQSRETQNTSRDLEGSHAGLIGAVTIGGNSICLRRSKIFRLCERLIGVLYHDAPQQW